MLRFVILSFLSSWLLLQGESGHRELGNYNPCIQKGAETAESVEIFGSCISFFTSCYVDHKTTRGLCAKESIQSVVSLVEIFWGKGSKEFLQVKGILTEHFLIQ